MNWEGSGEGRVRGSCDPLKFGANVTKCICRLCYFLCCVLRNAFIICIYRSLPSYVASTIVSTILNGGVNNQVNQRISYTIKLDFWPQPPVDRRFRRALNWVLCVCCVCRNVGGRVKRVVDISVSWQRECFRWSRSCFSMYSQRRHHQSTATRPGAGRYMHGTPKNWKPLATLRPSIKTVFLCFFIVCFAFRARQHHYLQ